MNDLIEFHIKHKYFVNIKKIKELVGCIAEFPTNKLVQHSEYKKTYILDYDNDEIETFVTHGSTPVNNKTTKCTKSNIRLMIAQDIMQQCTKLYINRKLILVEDGSKLFDILNIEQTEEEKHLEQKLCSSFSKFLNSQDYDSEIYGFSQMVDFLNEGREL